MLPNRVPRSLAALLLLVLAWAGHALSLAPPHNTDNGAWSITCSRCHYQPSGPTPTWATLPTTTDDTFRNNLCVSCHSASGMPLADPRFTDIRTHSAGQTGSTAWDGSWTVECDQCHSPHYQQQSTAPAYQSEPGLNIATGTVAAVSTAPNATTSSIADSGAALAPNAYVGYLLLPDAASPTRIYRIRSNTSTTITVDGAINPNYTGAGRTYAIRYGRLMNLFVGTPAGERPVRFFRDEGPASFASSSTVPDGICQVCHTMTMSFTNTGTLDGPGHPPGKAGTNCTSCHKHAAGFKADCLNCHGAPPLTAVPGPGGLASYSSGSPGTGSATPGAHQKHAQTLGYACETCHTGYAMPDEANRVVDIGFSVFGRSGGSYDGQSTVTYAGWNGTAVSKSGTRTCSNISCHGSAMAPNNGTDTTPVWDDPATGSCGTCHGATAAAPPARGSHVKHSRGDLLGYAYPCAHCHGDPAAASSSHVNDRSDVVLATGPVTSGGTYSGTPALLDAYGSCANVYCHSTVQSSPPGGAPVYRVTPAWGSEISSCGACHDYSPALATGSHAKHMQQPELRECYQCHNYTGSDDSCMACHDADTIEPRRDLHANHSIEVAFAPRYGGAYSGTPGPGDGYGSCSSTYCHGNYPGSGNNAVAGWGAPASGACGTCHGGSNTTVPDSGAHLRHADEGLHNYPCTLCHAGILSGAGPAGYQTDDRDKHANGVVDWAFDSADPRVVPSSSYSITTGAYAPSDGLTPRQYGSCSNLYCHSIAQTATGGPLTGAPGEYVVTPRWSASGGSSFCGYCHLNGSTRHNNGNPGPMSSGSHSTHLAYQFNARNNDGTYKCAICHRYEEQSWGTYNTCNACHSTSALYAGHGNGRVDVAFDTAFGAPLYDDATPTPGTPGNGFFTCSNTYCHGNGTAVATGVIPPNVSPLWGGTIAACDPCHGYPPAYGNGAPKANSHRSASHAGHGCATCHNATTATGTSITDRTRHVNKAYDVSPDVVSGVSFSYAYAAAGGTCSAVSCHAGGATRTWGQ